MDTRYIGLVKIAFRKDMEKTGTWWERYQAAHPIANTASYFVPGVGAAVSAGDALNAFSQGKVLSGLGNSLFAAASLIPAVGLLKGLGRGATLAARGGKGLPGALRANATVAAHPNVKMPVHSGAARLGRRASMYSHLPGVAGIAPYSKGMLHTGNQVARVARPFGGWKGVVGGLGLMGAGAYMEGRQPQLAGMAQSGVRDSGMPGFGTGGLFQAERMPGRFRDLPGMDPHLTAGDLPFSGTPTPRGLRDR